LAAATPNASPTATTTPKPSGSPTNAASKDVCGATKSKWAHLQCEEFNSSAPGDEYFGRMKMSYLGIDNTYKDGSVSAGAYTTDPHLIAKLDFATEALRRWASKYPNDPQLARSYFLAIQVLQKVYTQPEQEMTFTFMQLLATKYGNTYFGKTEKASLARGFTEHWFGLAQICPTPLPPGVMPETTPNATEIPSPAPGHAAVDVITPPCVQPSPTEEPMLETATPTPSAKATPTPKTRATIAPATPEPVGLPTDFPGTSGSRAPGTPMTPPPSGLGTPVPGPFPIPSAKARL
jgi:hypothetical protein